VNLPLKVYVFLKISQNNNDGLVAGFIVFPCALKHQRFASNIFKRNTSNVNHAAC
jgi:hypothetical protein